MSDNENETQNFSDDELNQDNKALPLQDAPSTDSTQSPESDEAFPLFLSFKANSPMEKVSDGVKEKAAQRQAMAMAQDSHKEAPTQVNPSNQTSLPPTPNTNSKMPSHPLPPKKKDKGYRPGLVALVIAALVLVALASVNQYIRQQSIYTSVLSSLPNGPTRPQPPAPSNPTSSTTDSPQATTVTVTISAATTPEGTTTVPTTTEGTTTAATTTEGTTTAATTQTPTLAPPARIPSAFSTFISDGKADGPNATFNLNFKNTGKSAVSFYDGIEYIQLTFVTNNVKITEVTSDDFTFAPDPAHSNSFIGTPVSQTTIGMAETRVVAIAATSDGAQIGKYTVNYYVKTFS